MDSRPTILTTTATRTTTRRKDQRIVFGKS